jgi:predicted PurR-regulated permease PerM
VLSVIIRILLPFLAFMVLYGLVHLLIKFFNRFPRLKPSERVQGYLFATCMILALVGVFTWPIFLPGLYEWLESMPQWFKDINTLQ